MGNPNIVVVFTDDQTFGAIGYNHPEVHTPNLDNLAREGLIFERAYVASPICAASRAAMMTGLFPQQNKVIALGRENFSRYLDGGSDAGLTLPSQLQSLGYRTVAFGKSHLGEPQLYGFMEGEETGPYDDVETFARVADFIVSDRAKSRPFFLWVAPRHPHVPLLPDQSWLDLYETDTLTLPKNFRIAPLLEKYQQPRTARRRLLPRFRLYEKLAGTARGTTPESCRYAGFYACLLRDY